MNKMRNAVRPFAYAAMSFLTVLSAGLMMWVLVALCLSGNIVAADMQDISLRLAGIDLFSLGNEPLWQTIIEIVVVALLCSCYSAWGSWGFSGNSDDGRWCWKYPRDIKLGATLLNVIMLIGVMHCVGAVSWTFSSPVKSAALVFAALAVVVALLYIVAYIGTRPLFVALVLKVMQCMAILIAFIVLMQSCNPAWSIVAILASVVWCYLLDCIEPCLTVRWATTKQRILDLLGISIVEDC